MIKSIIIAIVVAIVAWAISFELFFAYKGTVLSFGIAVAAGIIVGFILQAITPKIGLLVLAVALVTVVASFLASKWVPKEECVVGVPKVQCGPAGVKPTCIIIQKGASFNWDTSALPNGATVTIHKFKKRLLGIPFPAHPLTSDSYSGNNAGSIPATAKTKSGYYKYTITCGPGDEQDPMIEIPKK